MEKILAKKSFGQNFISDPHLINKIVDLLGTNSNSLVIEIGPGQGALTKQLVKRFDKVIAIEIDPDLEQILRSKIPDKNFELVIDDILNIDFKNFILAKKENYENVFVISNLPYYITSEILFKTLNVSNLLTKAVFMMQKEVATRVCADVNENNYNNLSIACEFYGERKLEFLVSKNMFRPIPKVDSAILSLTFNNKYTKLIQNSDKFLEFVRLLFNNRRKTILNNLSRVLNNKEVAAKYLSEVNIAINLRPENLCLEEYLKLFIKINSEKN